MSGLVQALQVASVVLNGASKAVSAADAGLNVYYLSKKSGDLTKTEKAALCANTLFAAVQAADIGIMGMHMASPGAVSGTVRLGVNGTAGATDVARVALTKIAHHGDRWSTSDSLDMAAILLYRCADVASTALDVHSNELSSVGVLGAVETGAQVVSTASVVIINRRQLYEQIMMGYDWVFPPISVPAQEQALAGEEEELIREAIDREIQSIINWRTLEAIPRSIAHHFPKCKLSGKPIRHLMQPAFPNTDSSFVFSRPDVESYFSAPSPIAPDWWPQGQSFALSSFRTASQFAQTTLIDHRLESLAQLYQGLPV